MGKDKIRHSSNMSKVKGFRIEDTAQFMLQKLKNRQPTSHESERRSRSSGRSRSPSRSRSRSPRPARGKSEEGSRRSSSGKWTVHASNEGGEEKVESAYSEKHLAKRTITSRKTATSTVAVITLSESDHESADYEDTSASRKERSGDKKQKKTSKKRRKIEDDDEAGDVEDVICLDEEEESPPPKKAASDHSQEKPDGQNGHRETGSRGGHSSREHHGRRSESRHHEHGQHYTQLSSELVDIIWLADDSQMLLVLSHPQEVCFQGKVKVQSLLGTVETFGHKMAAGPKEYRVFSPDCHSLLTLKTLPGEMSSKRFHKETVLETIIKDVGEVNRNVILGFSQKLKPKSVVVLLKSLDCPVCDFVSSFNPFHHMFRRKDNPKGKGLQGSLDFQIMNDPRRAWNSPETYRQAAVNFCERLQAVTEAPPIAVVCGGKNVGKSTLARYLLNTALNNCERVAYMECDVGQTEFTPSGCVSLSIVSQPLLGPPFTHQSKPHCMCYFGALSPGDEPRHYMQCLKFVYGSLGQLDCRLPLVVNTMGWNKGLGLQFLAETLRLIQPDLIIQLDSSNRNKNMPTLNSEFIRHTASWGTEQSLEPAAGRKESNLLVLTSPVQPHLQPEDRYKSPDHRNLTLLSYLGCLQPGGATSLRPLVSVKPYSLPWESVAVHVCHSAVPNCQVLCALNASIVALCIVDQQATVKPAEAGLPKFLKQLPVCQCLGFGLVRSIDPAEKMFYIVTPELLPTLQRVNCLVKGALSLPDQVLLNQHCGGAQLPYVGYSKDTHGATYIRPQRRHLARWGRDPH